MVPAWPQAAWRLKRPSKLSFPNAGSGSHIWSFSPLFAPIFCAPLLNPSAKPLFSLRCPPLPPLLASPIFSSPLYSPPMLPASVLSPTLPPLMPLVCIPSAFPLFCRRSSPLSPPFDLYCLCPPSLYCRRSSHCGFLICTASAFLPPTLPLCGLLICIASAFPPCIFADPNPSVAF